MFKHAMILSAVALALPAASALAADRTSKEAIELTKNVYVREASPLEQIGDPSNVRYPLSMALLAEVQSCGMDYSGPRCLDTKYEDSGKQNLQDTSGIVVRESADKTQWVLFSRFKRIGESRVLLMAVRANKAKNLPAFASGDIYAIQPVRAGRPAAENPALTVNYTRDWAACQDPVTAPACKLTPVISYDPAANASEAALADLSSTDPKRFYHAAAIVAKNDARRFKTALASALATNSHVVTDSRNDIYTQALLALAIEELGANHATVQDIAGDIFDRATPGAAQNEAAFLLANNGSRDRRVLAVVRAAIKSDDDDARRKAVTALSKIAFETADENLILAALTDDAKPVRAAAYEALPGMTLDNGNLPTLELALASPEARANPVRRNNIALAVARVVDPRGGTIEADKFLANMMKSPVGDGGVRETVVDAAGALVRRRLAEISDQDVAILLPIFSDSASAASDRAILASGVDAAVRNYGIDAVLAQFTKLARATNPDRTAKVRALVAAQLGRQPLFSARSVEMLVGLLADGNADVSNAADVSLAGLTITDAQLPVITRIVNDASSSALIRSKAVALLGKIQSADSVALLSQKATDADPQVRIAVAKAAGQFAVGAPLASEATTIIVGLVSDAYQVNVPGNPAAVPPTFATVKYPVRDEAMKQMDVGAGRPINDTQVFALSLYLTSSNDLAGIKNVLKYMVRTTGPATFNGQSQYQYVASVIESLSVLGREPRIDVRVAAVEALNGNLSDEFTAGMILFMMDNVSMFDNVTNLPVFPVRDAAIRYVGTGRVFNEVSVRRLAYVLSQGPSAESRKASAQYLGTASTQIAFDALNGRLPQEGDVSVQAAIRAALRNVCGRLPNTSCQSRLVELGVR